MWKLGKRRNGARYALAVYQSVVRQIYKIDEWFEAGTTDYRTRTLDTATLTGRWEFTGTIANELHAKYFNGSVRKYLAPNCQNPVTYVNC